MNTPCPLCHKTGDHIRLTGPLHRTYWMCGRCKLIFVGRDGLPDPGAEKARYLTHKNGPQYPGYVNFLNRAIRPALPHIPVGARGLDYGCGPVPTLSTLLKRTGRTCKDYDPFFFPELPEGPFDFIFSTECLEHFFDPAREMQTLCRLLNSGGVLTIMTEIWHHERDFREWYYPKDPTHVCFYHSDTIDYLSSRYGFQQVWSDRQRVFVLKKRESPDTHNTGIRHGDRVESGKS
ncbi:MAG: class I SAM-dependent methyltransferase [Balneolales bacterium]